jgi:hypothetical protein
MQKMGKYFVCLLGTVLMFTPRARADITLTNDSPTLFENAVSATISAGGGTIIVTTPIVITNDEAVGPFDGESKVTVSGGNTSSIFIVESGSLALANMTLVNGSGTTGGAIFVNTNGSVVLTSCTFSNNHVRGDDGEPGEPLDERNNVIVGKNGGRGTAGSPAYGGAIFSYGDVELFECTFITNSATGGTGGDGADGENAGTRGGKGGSGGIGGSAGGGAVFNFGTLVVSNCTFSGNVAEGGSGGAGGLGGEANIPGATGFSGAAGIAGGGGLYTADLNRALILNATFDHNTAHGGDGSKGGRSVGGVGQNGPRGGDALGGGIDNVGPTFIQNSTFFQNNALGGGGGDGGDSGARGGNGGAGGSAIGGGIYNASKLAVVNCTFSKGNALGGTNGAPGSGAVIGKNGKRGTSFGGNIANVAKKKAGGFQLFNSIIASALSGNGAYGTISNGGYNISADKSIKFKKNSHSLMNTNPFVGDLADNGGPTETIALTTNSVAVDFVPAALAPPFDQRGSDFPRPVGSDSDAGAYELDVNRVTILMQPQGTNVIIGSNATFTVTAGGTGPLFYQWYFKGEQILDATTNFLSITNAQLTNAGSYQVVVSNNFNTATSHVAVLSVFNFTNSPPVITQQPTNRQEVLVGTPVTISVTATSTVPIFYQWYFEDAALNDFVLTGATNNVLLIPEAHTTNFGTYQVVITNVIGAVTSSVSKLVVTNTPGDINPGAFLRLKRALPLQEVLYLPREPRSATVSAAGLGGVSSPEGNREGTVRELTGEARTTPEAEALSGEFNGVVPVNAAWSSCPLPGLAAIDAARPCSFSTTAPLQHKILPCRSHLFPARVERREGNRNNSRWC